MANEIDTPDIPPVSKLGDSFSSALYDLTTRFRLIKNNTSAFAKLIYFADLNLSINDLKRRRAIIASIPEDGDDEILEETDRLIFSLESNRADFIRQHLPDIDLEGNTGKGPISRASYSYKQGEFTFYFDPSILPSVVSRSSEHDPNFSLNNFLRSQLISLVTEFELFLSKIARGYFTNYEGSLENREVSIRLEDIKKFSDLNDIKERVIEHEIYQLTQGGIEEWQRFLNERFKIKLNEITPNFDQFKEIFLRRNLFVHNDGVVNKRYKDTSKTTKYNIGEVAEISEDYIKVSLEILKIVASSICFMGWHHLMKDKDLQHIRINLSDIGYDALKNEEWFVAERLYAHLGKYGSDEDKLVAKINEILCLKNTQRQTLAEEALISINYSMYNSKYIIGFAALKDDAQTFVEHAKLADISLGALLDWPILSGIKNDPVFKEFLMDKLLNESIATADITTLQGLDKKSIIRIATSQGIKASPSLNKSQLIDLIMEHQKTINGEV